MFFLIEMAIGETLRIVDFFSDMPDGTESKLCLAGADS